MEHFADKWERIIAHAKDILWRKGKVVGYGICNKNHGVSVMEYEDKTFSLSKMPKTSEMEFVNKETGQVLFATDKKGIFLRFNNEFFKFEEQFFGL